MISFPFLVFLKKLNFHVCFTLLDCDIRIKKLKKQWSQVHTAMSSLSRTVNENHLPLMKVFTVNNDFFTVNKDIYR